MVNNKIGIGIAGELLAAFKLSELGYAVGVTRKNTPNIDILVSNGKAAKIVQVKATDKGNPVWVCQKPNPPNKNIVYIFVLLNKDAPPSFHIVPSKDVLKNIEDAEAKWREEFYKKYGKKPNQGKGVSKFSDKECKYKNKWRLLGLTLDNAEAPTLG